MIFGLTGMSGAGKSTVCRQFKNAGFHIIDCDKVARQVVRKGEPCLDELHRLFGDGVITKDGELDRKAMGNIVFNDRDKLRLLNDTIYPYITYQVISELHKIDDKPSVLDAPTLFESGIDYICDAVVSVVCDTEISLERIMARDGISREAAESRLSSQHDAEFYVSRSQFCIENNGDVAELEQKTDEIVAQLLEMSKGNYEKK